MPRSRERQRSKEEEQQPHHLQATTTMKQISQGESMTREGSVVTRHHLQAQDPVHLSHVIMHQ